MLKLENYSVLLASWQAGASPDLKLAGDLASVVPGFCQRQDRNGKKRSEPAAIEFGICYGHNVRISYGIFRYFKRFSRYLLGNFRNSEVN